MQWDKTPTYSVLLVASLPFESLAWAFDRVAPSTSGPWLIGPD
jgi:hypothetical protein